jgi:hypothetical protein
LGTQPPGCLRVRNYTTIHIEMWHSGKSGRLSASRAWYPLLLAGSWATAAPGRRDRIPGDMGKSAGEEPRYHFSHWEPLGPCNNRHLAGRIKPRQPAQHQPSLTITRRQEVPVTRKCAFLYTVLPAGQRGSFAKTCTENCTNYCGLAVITFPLPLILPGFE